MLNISPVTEVSSKGPNNAGFSFLSPEEGNRSRFQNVVLSSYLEFRTMG
jgi:hypothetical protein